MMLKNNSCAIVFATLLALLGAALGTAKAATDSPIVIDATAAAHPLPHFWEQMFGSGRAILTLRDDYRRDLRDVKQVTDLQYVRFHAILHDEVGVYDEDAQGNAVYNFSYVDQIYDGLRAQGVRPFVEISFMPKRLAARDVVQEFFYHPNDSPPKDWAKWDALMKAFAEHLVARYGLDEVSQWYFEVWNEPNIGFWAGNPKQETYWELYDHTAADLKAVNARLRVGGPASAQAAWVDAFLKHCADKHVPVDFASTHVYGNDSAKDVFGTDEQIPRDKMVCRAVKKVHEQIQASPFPKMPLIWSEFNASYMNEPNVTDALYMGPWMAQTIGDCDGLVDVMSYWTFSDVFEEQGVVKTPFYGGFGLIAAGGIPKPSFNVFKVLHRLGDERLASDSDVLVTRRKKDGAIVAAVWNLAEPGAAGSPRTVHLRFEHFGGKHHVTIARVDRDHGDVLPAYEKMGSPTYPTQQQLVALRQAAVLPPDETRTLKGDELTLEIPAHGLAVIELK
jgi:xylan 1,4-beta-xylosidase